MSNIMLDLETMGTRPGSAILIIAAVVFEMEDTKWPSTETDEGLRKREHFYARIDLQSCVNEGLVIDDDTAKWWNSQEDHVRNEALPVNHTGDARDSIRNALVNFSKWYKSLGRNVTVWGNGSSFDCGIMSEAYKVLGMTVPWKYFLERDLRTVLDLGGVKPWDQPQINLHHALWDCWRQILGYQKAIRNISHLQQTRDK
jgi:DNA polymerase III epsilon subunit-like protein